jgi:hypothetical protein
MIEWIKCSEILPPKDQEVLVCKEGVISISSIERMFDDHPQWQDNVEDYFYWMTLPNAPNENCLKCKNELVDCTCIGEND